MIYVKNIVEFLSGAILKGNGLAEITQVESLSSSLNSNSISWCSQKNISQLKDVLSGTVLCTQFAEGFVPVGNVNYIIVENPRSAFRDVLKKYFSKKKAPVISDSANIHASVKLGKNIFIGHHVVIEENCEIGDNTVVEHNTVIFSGTKIGNNVKIGANCTLGGIGFGYEKNDAGMWEEVPHIGNVLIHDFVEIGNNTAIDRAVIGSTEIHEYVKIDNLVHVAHGVKIGKNSLIIANSMIGGSTTIGENVWVAPSSSLLNKLNIENDTFIGMGAVVIRDVNKNEKVVGNPAKVIPAKPL